ncbi:hypothetical protein DXC40_16595 [Anaerotruncus colihominis]|uniref:Uncharacterized protein n=1 Tax=Anaerotruncus colihominis TaxID=169435 RepID=A0A3E3IEX4_9FIRM|nr:hypothetical protein DXC40_16595 [Anaerotruncus colihominis]
MDAASFLRTFHALRQSVPVTVRRRAFFYLLKGVKAYEPETQLSRLRDVLRSGDWRAGRKSATV